MRRFNDYDGYKRIVQEWKEEIDGLDYCYWAWRWNFWRFIFQFLSKFYDISLEEIKAAETEDVQKILKSFVWANALSIERYHITAKSKNVQYENWQKLSEASLVFDKMGNVIQAFQPKIILLLNWNASDQYLPLNLGEPVKFDPIPLWYYHLASTDTHLFCTKHPRSLMSIGYDVVINKIINSINRKKIFRSFPGQTRFDLIRTFVSQMRELGKELNIRFVIEKTNDGGTIQIFDGIDYTFVEDDLYDPLVGLYFYPLGWKNYRIGFSNSITDFYYGICRQNWQSGDPMIIFQKLTPLLNALNEETNDSWPRGKYFDYRNWDKNSDVWREIEDGRLKAKIRLIISNLQSDLNEIDL